jgi:uncharacterized protein (TIRG00374 family)
MNWRKLAGPALGVVLSLLFLWLAFYKVQLNQVLDALRAADYRLIALAALFTFLGYFFRTLRWGRFLLPQKRIPVSRLYPVLVIGFALNNIFPGRPGEFARAISLGQREGLPKTLGLATVVLERVMDGLTLIAIFAVIALGFDLPGWGRNAEIVSIAIFAFALAAILILLWRQDWAAAILARVASILPARLSERLNRMFGSFMLGLHALRSPRDVLAIAFYSFGVWLCEGVHYFLILSAFGILSTLSARAQAAAFTLVIVNLSIAIPAAPGGVGAFEWAGRLALGVFGVAAERAIPAVLVAHTIQYLLVTGLGVLFTAREGVRLTQAVETVERSRAESGGA